MHHSQSCRLSDHCDLRPGLTNAFASVFDALSGCRRDYFPDSSREKRPNNASSTALRPACPKLLSCIHLYVHVLWSNIIVHQWNDALTAENCVRVRRGNQKQVAKCQMKNTVHSVSKNCAKSFFSELRGQFIQILIIFGRMMAKKLKLCEVHSFSTSPNSRHHTTLSDLLQSELKMKLLEVEEGRAPVPHSWRRHCILWYKLHQFL